MNLVSLLTFQRVFLESIADDGLTGLSQSFTVAQ